jgi:hypothetical protein
MLSAIFQNVFMLSVVMLSVVAPKKLNEQNQPPTESHAAGMRFIKKKRKNLFVILNVFVILK